MRSKTARRAGCVGRMAILVFVLSAAAIAAAPRGEPAPAVTVRGQALTLGGKPVAGVKVTCVDFSGGRQTTVAQVTTGPDGGFRMVVSAAAVHGLQLQVDAPPGGAFAPCAMVPPSPFGYGQPSPADVRILLAPATARLEGTVKTEDDKPVPGTTVTLALAQHRSWFQRTATTDQLGRFSIARLAPGPYVIQSVDPPAGSEWIRLYTWKPFGVRSVNLGAGATAKEDLVLPRGAKLTGRVLDEEGKPLAGASVSCRLDSATEEGKPSVYQMPGQWYSATATTGPDGRYVLGALTQETYCVTVQPPEGSPDLAFAVLRGVNAPKGADVALQDLTLYKGGKLGGTLVGQDGKPVAGAEVSIVVMPGRFAATEKTQTDTAGRFAFTALPSGKYSVTVRPPDGSPWCEHVFGDLGVISGLSLEHELKLPRGASLSGAVSDPDGKPVGGASVSLRFGYSQRGKAQTDPDGKFRIVGISTAAGYQPMTGQPEKWEVLVAPPPTAPLLTTTSVTLAEAPTMTGAELDVRMHPGAQVTGVVADADGRPLAGVRVWASQQIGRGAISSVAGGQTSEDGAYTIMHLKPGKWSVVADPPDSAGLLGESAPPRDLPPGKTTEINVALKRGATIVGKVLTSGGEPVAGASVRLEPGRDGQTVYIPWGGGQQTTAYTGADGGFRLEAVGPGTHKLHCTPIDPQVRADPAEVKVSGTGEHKVTIRAFLTGTVAGTVCDEAGKPPARGTATFLLERGMGAGAQRVGYGYPDEQGRFRFERMLPGEYALVTTISPQGRKAGLSGPGPLKVVVYPGKETKIEVKIRKEQPE